MEEVDDNVQDKYCSCLFDVMGSSSARSPYAICSSSVYNRRGLKGPGSSISCKYSEDFLRSKSYSKLLAYAQAKGLINEFSNPQIEDLIKMIANFLVSEGKYEKKNFFVY